MMRLIQAAARVTLWKQAVVILVSLGIINRVPALRAIKTT